MLIADCASVGACVRECAGPFGGLPEIVTIDDARKAEVSGLRRSTDAAVDAVAGTAAVSVMMAMAAGFRRRGQEDRGGRQRGQGCKDNSRVHIVSPWLRARNCERGLAGSLLWGRQFNSKNRRRRQAHGDPSSRCNREFHARRMNLDRPQLMQWIAVESSFR